ncbi:metallophosphoesterase (TIGR00282 family) [Mycoplasmoides fastidiosum]|uniref:Metallophosphoesterase (TIGR00282 family) n=1 Tax=Mycoplasmoides fastidiosum TaxID=92758 RepID=A0ABU0LZK9_9BACT|nr:TIGR00282 family metallophosphoesterase [Mycoplasmoides fastidiosum]MDQ0514129.1 metallophosphoesterase (TIGR00282 family) [Mycoplasmoides fastidiosum]UUD37463.1 TIGR00282 family metallophosphoesterase [Mycoplasmoides fastidiosum]
MRILFIGDIFGAPGREIIKQNLAQIITDHQIDFVIANAENAAHGKGITPRIYEELKNAKIDFITMGNHTWAKKEGLKVLAEKPDIIRPLNLASTYQFHDVGVGSVVVEFQNIRIRISNLLGSTVRFVDFHTNESYILNPFAYFENFLAEHHDHDIHIVDFHAETTSEKNAFLRAFNGQVDAILGTHTHVPTNDFQIYNQTAYITDVGMTGPAEGIIGGDPATILDVFFARSKKFKLDVASGLKQLCAVVMEFNDQNQIQQFWPLILKEDRLSGTSIIQQIN